VQLILDGALDAPFSGGEAELGARLGASPRHLRRLFVEHLGATPDALARSRRAHFARRLLDDTEMPMSDVAFASGFGSIRQFNRTMAETFRATPRELRARRRAADRLVADGGLCIRLPFTPPFDGDAVLGYLSSRAIAGVEAVEAGAYRRTVEIDGDPGAIEVVPGGPDHLVLRAHLPHWEGLIHVVERARRIFGLDVEPAPANATLAHAPVVGPLVRARPGLRMAGTWSPFEIGVRAIVGQQVSVAGANTLMARLVERHGRAVPGLSELGLSRLFPAPSKLADAGLDGLGLTTARAAAIRAFAAAVADGKVPLDRSVPLDDLVETVAALRGLGPWTAQYLALRAGEPDAFPAGDLGLRRAAERITGRPISARGLAELSDAWRPWRAHAAVQLWSAL
jgi:AraC family transcriptional regulator of adaptative response / DNA-3-methyladenine glycosylase II